MSLHSHTFDTIMVWLCILTVFPALGFLLFDMVRWLIRHNRTTKKAERHLK